MTDPISTPASSAADSRSRDPQPRDPQLRDRMPALSFTREDLQTLGILLAALVVIRCIGMITIPVYDDAFITFRYARNLARGLGLVYNPGEYVLGTTTPLFALLLAVPAALGLPLPETTRILNLLFDGATAVMLYGIAARTGHRAAGIAAVLLFSADPILVRVSTGGMEMSLFVACSLLALLLFARGRWTLAALSAGAACSLRPEGVLLCAVLGAALLLRRRWGTALLAAGIMAAAVALPAIVFQLVYGSPFPQSVASKSSQLFGSIVPVVAQLVAPHPAHAVLFPFMLWGGVLAWRAGGPYRIALAWAIAYALVFLALRPAVWSWYFFAPWIVGVLACGFWGEWALGRVRRLRRAGARRSTPIAAGLAVLAWIGILAVSGKAPVTTGIYEGMERWFAAHPAGGDILATDIGAVGYFSGVRIIDGEGLISPECTGETDYRKLVERWDPEWLFVTVSRRYMAGASALAAEGRYLPVVRFSKRGDGNLHPPVPSLPEKWEQEYILYRRNPAAAR